MFVVSGEIEDHIHVDVGIGKPMKQKCWDKVMSPDCVLRASLLAFAASWLVREGREMGGPNTHLPGKHLILIQSWGWVKAYFLPLEMKALGIDRWALILSSSGPLRLPSRAMCLCYPAGIKARKGKLQNLRSFFLSPIKCWPYDIFLTRTAPKKQERVHVILNPSNSISPAFLANCY